MDRGVTCSAYTTYQQLPFVHLSSLEVHTPLMQSAPGKTEVWLMQATKEGAITYQKISVYRHVYCVLEGVRCHSLDSHNPCACGVLTSLKEDRAISLIQGPSAK